jgi:lysozyme family protein
MANFEIANRLTRKFEGGYHNGAGINSNDRGGETFKGIARKIWPNWDGWVLVDRMKNVAGFPGNAERDPVLKAKVDQFFKTNFWDSLKLDDVKSQIIANELFDTGVNMGTSTAAKMLQDGLNFANRAGRLFPNLTVDGAIGRASLAAVNGLNEKDSEFLFVVLNVLQGYRYFSIAKVDESQEANARGWFDRVQISKP